MADGTGKPDKISLEGILNGAGSAGPPAEDDAEIEIVSDVDASGRQIAQPAAVSAPDSAPRSSPAEDDPGAGQVEELLREAMVDRERLNDLYLRARADLDNFRKRMEREREEDRLRTAAGILREIIPGLDNLDRALAQPAETPGFREGVALIRRQLGESLRKMGMEPIEALGEPFDPAFHEAVAAEPRAGFATNTIIEEICKGYIYAGRVLRPSMVKVVIPQPAGATGAAATSPAGEDRSQGGSVGPDHRD